MKSYSVTEVTHLDSTSLGAMIENHINYTVDTIILAQAELKRRGEFLENHHNALHSFCSENNITNLDSELNSILEKNEIAQNEWKQLGRNNTQKLNSKNFAPIIEKGTKNNNPESNWKEARNGIIIFCVIHFIFEVASGNPKFIGPMIFANFFISKWFIQRQINKGIEQNNFLQYGLMVSGIVFLIRLSLGTLVYLLIMN
jgi:hypothetical protein